MQELQAKDMETGYLPIHGVVQLCRSDVPGHCSSPDAKVTSCLSAIMMASLSSSQEEESDGQREEEDHQGVVDDQSRNEEHEGQYSCISLARSAPVETTKASEFLRRYEVRSAHLKIPCKTHTELKQVPGTKCCAQDWDAGMSWNLGNA